MYRGGVTRGRVAAWLGIALSLSLGVSAVASNLQSNRGASASGPIAVDTTDYRSSTDRHKVKVASESAMYAKSVTVLRRHEYGSFQLLEVDRATADRLIASGVASNADGQNLILFNSGAIDTTTPAIAADGRKALASETGRQLHLIQFPGPITPAWYAQLEATGAQIVNAVPSNAYLVYGTPAELDRVAVLAGLGVAQWHGPYLAAYKLQPGVADNRDTAGAKSLATSRGAAPDKDNNLFRIQLVRDTTSNAVTEALYGLTKPISRHEVSTYVNIVVALTPDELDTVSQRPDVISIAVYREPKRMDERQNMILAGNLISGVPNAGNYFTTLSGWGFTQSQFTTSGLVVDVTDDGADRNPTGADPGTIATNANAGPVPSRHFVLRESGTLANTSRFTYKGRWGSGSTADGGLGASGHGQLNMSIIGGYVPDSFDTGNALVHRDAQGFRFGLGVAPFVGMGNSVIFDPGFTSPSYPNLLNAAYVGGARISSNSWGADNGGAYDSDAQTYDILVRDSQSAVSGNQQMLIVFAAGNAGPGAQTVGTPGTGKNVLTVGAGENVRSHSAANGGNAGNTAGNDGCATPDTEANNANDMAPFSSRGPTADGRKKPDIVAPGTHVTGMTFVAAGQDPTSPANGLGAAHATYRADGVCGMPGSGTAGSANNFFPVSPAQRWYTTSSGTSHSTPAVSGSAALIYQQFLNNPSYIGAHRTPAGSAGPSPALVKAYLTNAARYMNGTGANDTLPSNNQGMGSVNLGMAFDSVQRVIRDQVAADRFTASGQVRTFVTTVTSAAAPLRVSLAYTDKEGPTSGNAFVNNLDLAVTVAGMTYKGNVFSGATSVAGGSADTRNNLESVFLPAGLPVGTPVIVQVIASNIAGQADPTVAGLNQDFALVIYNAQPGASQAALAYASSTVGSGNGVIDPNECNDLTVSLSNPGTAGASAISATLSSSTPGVTLTQASSAYPNIAAGSTAANTTAFKVSTSNAVACGSTVNFSQITNYTGGVSPVTSQFSLIVGSPANATIFSENFDGVAAPALPAGWTTVRTGTAPPALFATTSTGPDTVPNVAFTNGVTTAATNSLISPAITLPASPFPSTLTFRHAWNFELSQGEQWDGGILELSTDAGTNYDNVVSTAIGGSFTAGGYTGTISTADTNPLAGQPAWGGAQASFVTSTLSLPAALNGQTIQLRWRGGWDSAISAASPNWRIDSISLTGGVTCATGSGVCVVSNVPPTLAYAPTAGSTVTFAGVTTVGSTGTGSITVTPSGGSGTGGAATSTVNGCAVSGTDAGSFAGAAAINLSLVGTTTTPQSIGLSCTAGSAKRTATLTCNETLGAGNPATPRTWPLTCPIGCSLDINGDGNVTADKDAMLLARYLLGFRSGGLVANIPLGPLRADAAAVESYIGTGAQFDVFGRPSAAATAMQDGIVLFRLMLGVPDTGLFGGIAVPAGATFSTPGTVRSHVNTMCGTSF